MAVTNELPATASALLLRSRDVRFVLYEWLDLDGLCERDRYRDHSRATFDDVLELAERIATDRFAPHARKADDNEPHIDADGVVLIPEIGQALEAHADAGFISMAMDEALGGAQLPHLLATACQCWFAAANPATAVYNGLTASAANLIAAQGSPEQVGTWLAPMLEGRFFGTMCLSETQAGSALADIATRAEPQPDGTYRLFGTKMWIGGGDHSLGENIVHLVLAKLPDAPPGTQGISMFIVPKWLVDDAAAPTERNDVVVAGLNHKMGQRGTVNAVLGFGEGAYTPGAAPGAVGYLVGQPHRGLAGMFQMMNEARVEVGTVATAIGYTAYLRSLQYARERLQGRPLGEPPEQPPVPIIRHPDVRRMLLAQKSYTEGALALVLYAARLLDDIASAPEAADRERAELLLSTLTPIVKSWPSQYCLEANSLAIQIHGGYGYARDYEVERLYRDNRISAIYEGTHGIQALDLVGRHVLKNRGAGIDALLAVMADTIARAQGAGPNPAELARNLDAAATALKRTTAGLAAAPEIALAQATAYLEALGHLVVAWLWLEQTLAACGKDGDFYDGKRAAACFFYRHELPRVHLLLDLLDAQDRSALDLQESWL